MALRRIHWAMPALAAAAVLSAALANVPAFAQDAAPVVVAAGPVADRPAATAPADTQPQSQTGNSIEDRLIVGPGGPDGGKGQNTIGGWLGATWWSLGLIILLIFVAAYVLKRVNPAATAARGVGIFRVLARWHLASRQYVTLVQVGRRMLLLGVTGQQITMLAEVSDPAEIEHLLANCQPAGRSILGDGFSQLLGRHREQMANEDDESASSANRAVGQLSGLIGRLKTKLSGKDSPSP